MKRLVRILAALALVTASVLAITTTAGAQTVAQPTETTTGACTITITIVVGPGGQVTVTTNCYPPGTIIIIVIILPNGAQVLGEAVVAADGTATFDFDAPDQCGTYTVEASDDVTTQSTQFSVEGCDTAAAVTPAGALPYTGGDSLPVVQIGVALLAAGALVTLVARKRHAAGQA